MGWVHNGILQQRFPLGGAVAATATFPAAVASHSAQRNCLSWQEVRLYYPRRRHFARALEAAG